MQKFLFLCILNHITQNFSNLP